MQTGTVGQRWGAERSHVRAVCPNAVLRSRAV